ncbi:MAG: DUF5671 domain-containing protein [Actinomycetia bacterium]|nr:DUF5671 domain-containing protein [Actinomycetes bacterium]
MATDRWSLRNIYLYLVCLITLMMVIFSVVNIVRSTVELIYPDPGYMYEVPAEKGGTSGLSQAQIDQQNMAQAQQSKRQAVLGLVGGAAMLVVAGPLYIYHWRKIETERPAEAVQPLQTA